MIKLLWFMDATVSLLGERFPEEKIYQGQLPEGFTRPAIQLSIGSVKAIPTGINAMDMSVTLAVKGFTVNDSSDSKSGSALQQCLQEMLSLFSSRCLTVGDRKLTPNVCSGAILTNPDVAEMRITYNYLDDRDVAEVIHPTMQDIKIRR